MINKIKEELIKSKKFASFSLLRIVGDGLYYALPLILAKILSPENFGSFILAQMFATIMTTVFIASAQTPFIVNAGEEYARDGKMNKNFTVQTIFMATAILLGLSIMTIFKNFFIDFSSLKSGDLAGCIVFYIGVVLKKYFENIFLASNEKHTSAAYSSLIGGFNLVLLYVLAQKGEIDISDIFFIYSASTLISTVIFMFRIDLYSLFPLKLEKKILGENLHWISWQVMGLVAVYLINWGDNLVLRYYSTTTEVGKYNIGYQFFKAIIGASLIVNTYFLPSISRNIGSKEEIKKYLNEKRFKIYALELLIVATSFWLLPFFILHFYGSTYIDSVSVIKILLIAAPFQLFNVFYIPILNSLKKYKFIHINNTIIVIINIALDFLLIPYFGISGAAIATTIAYAVSFINYKIYFHLLSRSGLI